LIVGGAGYVGGWLTDQLISVGHEVRVFDLLLYEDRYMKPVPFVFGDVLDRPTLEEQLAWADTVVWLAALVGDPACGLNEDLTKRINCEALKPLWESFDGRVIFPSTCSVYGAQDDLLDESSPTNPLSRYAETKLIAEQILIEKRPDALVLRLATLSGIGDDFSRIRLDLVVNLLVANAMVLGRLKVFGGQQYRPIMHVRDVATAVVDHVDTDARGIYNLGSENVRIGDLAARVAGSVPGSEVEYVDTPFQDTRNYRVSFEKARSELGFEPAHSLQEAIEILARLVSDGRIAYLSFTGFSNHQALRPYLSPEAIPFGREVLTSHTLARHSQIG